MPKARMGHEAHLPDDRQALLRPEPQPDRQPLHGRGRGYRIRPPQDGRLGHFARCCPKRKTTSWSRIWKPKTSLLEGAVADDTELDDDLLEDDADDTVSLDDLADVPGDEEEV